MPQVRIWDTLYFQDDRLKEFRAVDNPHVRITYDEFFTALSWGHKRDTGCLEPISDRAEVQTLQEQRGRGEGQPRGTHVFLFKEKEFPMFEDEVLHGITRSQVETHKLKPGIYEVEGFYADAIKLIQGSGWPIGRDFVIPSTGLKEFWTCKVR